jgi:hypothetical protein
VSLKNNNEKKNNKRKLEARRRMSGLMRKCKGK